MTFAGDGATFSIDDVYGHRVALAADGSTLVVTATGADDGAGAACVFRTTNGGASRTKIARIAPEAGHKEFGMSVALDGQFALVGAKAGAGTSIHGAAYLYQLDFANWLPTPQASSA